MQKLTLITAVLTYAFVSSAAAQSSVGGSVKPKAVIGGAAVQANPVVPPLRGATVASQTRAPAPAPLKGLPTKK